jgi:L,D-peptidoglycan transpeptidase YkuD (ErfK/YbiS/YcfS/YnhG family)
VWAGDPLAPTYYNRHVRCAPYTCPFRVTGYSERLINYPHSYAYAMFIGYNAPTPYGQGWGQSRVIAGLTWSNRPGWTS